MTPADLTYNADGLIPAIVQDAGDGTVLMMAWMDRAALERTLETGQAWFYSRSRKTSWRKGEQSGNTLQVQQVSYDCDGDTLLLTCTLGGDGVACHTGERTCFYRELRRTP
ncbi:MAG: phosphoribosyl-AMP cyclohydrolase [Coriobacteriia bacterium]|nr:phosphoribosyl-AMP cyclohydrolase [Coriobacteriia bacterium]